MREEKRIHLILWHRQKFSIELLTWHLSMYYFPTTPWFTYSENSKGLRCSVSSNGYGEDVFWGLYSSSAKGDQKHQPEKWPNTSAVSTHTGERPFQNKASTVSPRYDQTKFTGKTHIRVTCSSVEKYTVKQNPPSKRSQIQIITKKRLPWIFLI